MSFVTQSARERAAFLLALQVHEDQPYGRGEPYIVHLADVVRTLRAYGVQDEDLFCAGWLHDSKEDTSLTIEVIQARLGGIVAGLVDAVSNPPGPRKERHRISYPRIRDTQNAVVLKLADRCSNVKKCWADLDARLFMYREEHPEFRRVLRSARVDNRFAEIVEKMWSDLNALLGR